MRRAQFFRNSFLLVSGSFIFAGTNSAAFCFSRFPRGWAPPMERKEVAEGLDGHQGSGHRIGWAGGFEKELKTLPGTPRQLPKEFSIENILRGKSSFSVCQSQKQSPADSSQNRRGSVCTSSPQCPIAPQASGWAVQLRQPIPQNANRAAHRSGSPVVFRTERVLSRNSRDSRKFG